MAKRTLVAAAAVLAALAFGVQPAAAIDRAQAVKIALATLAPQKQKGRVVVFATPSAVPKGSSLVEAGPRKLRRGAFEIAAPLTTGKLWLVWADLAYGARFQHPSRLVLVDDRGRASTPQRLVWWPLVNGKAPFGGAGYGRQRHAVWSNVPKRAARRAPATTRGPARTAPLPAGATRDDCLITIGLKNDPQFKQDFPGLAGAFRRLGVRVFNPGHPSGADADGRDLADAVDLITKPPHNCKDVILYIDGHGYETGPTGVLVGYRYTPTVIRRGKQWYRMEARTVSAADVEGILRDHRETTFKVIVDACYSGRFVLDLPKSENPNLLALETASRADEVSWSHLRTVTVDGVVYESRTNNPGNASATAQGRGEFTNGFIAGLTAAAASADEVAAAQGKGGSLLARLIARAAELGKNQDLARWAGLTVPRSGGAYGGASDPGTPAPPTSPAFTIGGSGWYQHFTGKSAICVRFDTTAAKPNAATTVTVSGGSVLGPRTRTTRLDSRGEGTARFEIDEYGTYSVEVSVTAGGRTVTRTFTITVTAAAGSAACG